MKIEHLAINTPDPRAAADWYAPHLGFKVVRSGPAPKHGRFLVDDRGMVIELYDDPADRHLDLAKLGETTFHLALASEDIERDIERLCAAGARQVGDINDTPRGDRLAFLRDPFGLTLQLAQRREPLA
ncbi:VOC family protein [Chelativorans sp.]|uniref:VOC family protein n=1 Tax=Chelativorans sp. TaxID=2203393 RepID=UPI002811A1EE|nr:VOC family protein [Chelativorans sp.]